MGKEEVLFQEIAASIPSTEISQMFGKPCVKLNGKAFICFFQNEMVFKLGGDEHANALKLKGAQLFDPSGKGRAMKEWVQVPYAYHAQWETLAKQALNYLKAKN